MAFRHWFCAGLCMLFFCRLPASIQVFFRVLCGPMVMISYLSFSYAWHSLSPFNEALILLMVPLVVTLRLKLVFAKSPRCVNWFPFFSE